MIEISNKDADALVRVMPMLRQMRDLSLSDDNSRRLAVLALRRLERKTNQNQDTAMSKNVNINPNRENSASQTTLILEYMKQGHAITPLDALRHFGCMRLQARVHDIEKTQGIQVKRQRVKVRNQFGTEVSVMSYSL